MDGSIAADCSDGSQRFLTLAGPDDHVLPAGPRCKARTQPLVGALAFPLGSGGESEAFPSEPAILQHPG